MITKFFILIATIATLYLVLYRADVAQEAERIIH